MGETTSIAWCHHTFNGWIGCSEAGPECDHCYAREQNKRWKWNGGEWGPGALREVTSSANWRQPLKWNAAAKAAGERRRVFAFSLADVADAEAPQDAYPFLWQLVEETTWLDWLFLTKRPARIVKIVPPLWLEKPPQNVWWGTSVGTQKSADAMIPLLLRTPAAVRFLSCEPLLEAVNIDEFLHPVTRHGYYSPAAPVSMDDHPERKWVIVGGESGAKCRPMELPWAVSLKEQCAAAGVAFFFKQQGGHPDKRDRMEQFPVELRVRAFPEVRNG